MKILAFEFSCDERSVAVLDSARSESREVVESGGRSVNAISMIDAVLPSLQMAGVEPSRIYFDKFTQPMK